MAAAVSISSLPPEVLKYIFQFLDPSADHDSVERVCHQWSEVIVLHFWRPHLERLLGNDPCLKAVLEQDFSSFLQSGTAKIDDIRKTYAKALCMNRWKLQPKIHSEEIKTEQACRVSTFRVWQNVKAFISYDNGALESRSLPGFALINALVQVQRGNGGENGEMEEEEEFYNVNRKFAISLHDSKLVSIDQDRKSLHLWNAEDESHTGQFHVPPGQNLQSIYAVKVNSTHIVCLVSWSLVGWLISERSKAPTIVLDIDERNEAPFSWAFEHGLDLNTRYVVTFVNKPLSHDGRKSLLHCRQLRQEDDSQIFDPCLRPATSLTNRVEIENVLLSSSSLDVMAVFQIEEDIEETTYYSVNIIEVKSGVTLRKLTSESLFSQCMVPMQWLDERLFLYVVPRNEEPQPDTLRVNNNECEVSLLCWDFRSNQTCPLDHAKVSNLSNQLHVSHPGIVKLSHKVCFTSRHASPTFKIEGTVYDYWKN